MTSVPASITPPSRPLAAARFVAVAVVFTMALAVFARRWPEAFALGAGTLVSEDLACLTGGTLVAQDKLHWLPAVLGCFTGIYLGDLALYAVGRVLGRRFLASKWLLRHTRLDVVQRQLTSLERSVAAAVFASRGIPGARLPVYVAAGALGVRPSAFALWTLIAAAAWTPVVVLGAAKLGGAVGIGTSWLALGTSALGLAVALHVVRRARRIWDKLRRWEFWPAWLFYLPIVPYIAWLSLRHRSFTVITSANPAIPHGGFVGESKSEILAKLPRHAVLPFALIAPGDGRVETLRTVMQKRGWTFPLILKPDVGQRGAGVKLARSFDDAAAYLTHFDQPVIAQVYHPGPYEAGIFYYRFPGQPHGRIFSVTDKRFPQIVGDGVSTLAQLIRTHPRYRLQAGTFLARHVNVLNTVLGSGETFDLALAGNHCQGTMFVDGSSHITPELERAVDSIARGVSGFYFGRFDVRYSDVEAFKAGRDFHVVELNGITSESTNVYDPSFSLVDAYCILVRQWRILFQIGAANRTRGVRPSRLTHLVRDTIRSLRAPRPALLSN